MRTGLVIRQHAPRTFLPATATVLIACVVAWVVQMVALQCGPEIHEGLPLCSGTEQEGIQRPREKTGSCGTWKGARASRGGARKKQVTGQEALAWLWSHLAAPTTPLRDTFPGNFCDSSTAQRLNVPQSCS